MLRQWVEIEGYRIDRVTKKDYIDLAMSVVNEQNGGWVLTPNVDMLRQCKADPVLGDFIRESTITIADGMPLVWASHLQGTPLPERVAGSTTMLMLVEAAAQQGHSIFLLGGGKADTATRAAAILTKKYQGLAVAGTYFPPFGFENDEEEFERMMNAINESKPDIVFYALSFPKGEYLARRIRRQCHPALWIGVGISFSFITQDVKRAPHWMRSVGLEWLYRIIQEPRRMYKRYLIHDIPVAVAMLWRALLKRFRDRPHYITESSSQLDTPPALE